MGAMAVPMLLSGASAAANVANTRRTERRQDRALADKTRRQGQKQREADARVNATLDTMARSRPHSDRAAALSEYVAQVAANRGNMAGAAGQAGRTSDAFADAASDAALGVAAETSERAGQMSIQDGAGRQREREGRDQVRLGGDIGLIRREADGLAYLDDMRIRNIRRNPWLDAAASVLGGMAASGVGVKSAPGGSGMAGAAGWGGAPRSAAPVNFAPHLKAGNSPWRHR